MQYRGVVHCVGETIHTLMQYRGVVHCVGGDNTHTLMQYRGWSTVCGETIHTLMQYRGGGPPCVRRQHAH